MCAKRKKSSETENGANPARLREEARRKLKREMEVSKTKIIILLNIPHSKQFFFAFSKYSF